MTEWQPIETAPKDGTEIIGVFPNDYGYQDKPTVYGPWTMRWSVGEWVSSWDGERVIQSQSDFGTDYKDLDIGPTHWQPIPSPPQKPQSCLHYAEDHSFACDNCNDAGHLSYVSSKADISVDSILYSG